MPIDEALAELEPDIELLKRIEFEKEYNKFKYEFKDDNVSRDIRDALFHIFNRVENGEPHKNFHHTLYGLTEELMLIFMHSKQLKEESALQDAIIHGTISIPEMKLGVNKMYFIEKQNRKLSNVFAPPRFGNGLIREAYSDVLQKR